MEETTGTRVLMMGNEAIARGAVEAGISVAASYPGTPSSEIMGTLAGWAKQFGYHAEWSVNEKVAAETAAGAAYTGARAIVSLKQMGLNVASDAVMSLAYIGVEGGLVLAVADDPGPHSSQTEQDTRYFATFAKLPVMEPSSAQEAKDMTKWAFELSEALHLPVIVRPTTRSSHSHGDVVLGEITSPKKDFAFIKDPKWCILPSLSAKNHVLLENKQEEAKKLFAESPFNWVEKGETDWAVITSGVSYNYVKEALELLGMNPTILKIGSPYPLPDELALGVMKKAKRIIVIEEQEPVIEDQIIRLAWKNKLNLDINGKWTGEVSRFGEFNVERVKSFFETILGISPEQPEPASKQQAPTIPGRPPILCAGCSHRATFYAFKEAGKKNEPVYCGDIGCYTLGYAPPLKAQDTCLCMGGGITIAYGLSLIEKDRPHIAYIGDSTFLHAGMTGTLNLVYNKANVTVVILDNQTTAMTGFQPHPGVGLSATGDPAPQADLEKIVRGLGVEHVETVNPNDIQATIETAQRALDYSGPSGVIARAPCINRIKLEKSYFIDKDDCSECEICIEDLGCPSIIKSADGVVISDTCAGCGICVTICPTEAIKEVSK